MDDRQAKTLTIATNQYVTTKEIEHKTVIRMDVLHISSPDTKRYIFADTTNKRKKPVLNDNYLTIRFNENKIIVVNPDTGCIEE